MMVSVTRYYACSSEDDGTDLSATATRLEACKANDALPKRHEFNKLFMRPSEMKNYRLCLKVQRCRFAADNNDRRSLIEILYIPTIWRLAGKPEQGGVSPSLVEAELCRRSPESFRCAAIRQLNGEAVDQGETYWRLSAVLPVVELCCDIMCGRSRCYLICWPRYLPQPSSLNNMF